MLCIVGKVGDIVGKKGDTGDKSVTYSQVGDIVGKKGDTGDKSVIYSRVEDVCVLSIHPPLLTVGEVV